MLVSSLRVVYIGCVGSCEVLDLGGKVCLGPQVLCLCQKRCLVLGLLLLILPYVAREATAFGLNVGFVGSGCRWFVKVLIEGENY